MFKSHIAYCQAMTQKIQKKIAIRNKSFPLCYLNTPIIQLIFFRNYTMLGTYWRKFSSGWTVKDYYAVLGVKYGASAKEIRAGYLTQAKKFHPDSPTGDTEKFKVVAHAYETLNDPRNKLNAINKDKETKKKNWNANEEQDSKHEYDEKNYRNWRENRSWNQSSRESNFDSQGFEYSDPYAKQSERYTYSQFKKDKYNKVYKDPPRPIQYPKQEQSSNSSFGTVLVALTALTFLTVSKA